MKNLIETILLKGKKTLISGVASGIGRAISYRFAEAGSDLMLLDIDEKGLNTTKELLNIFECDKQTFKIDLSKKEEIDLFWENIGENLPDILINNAGIYPFKDYLQVDENFYAKTLEINLEGTGPRQKKCKLHQKSLVYYKFILFGKCITSFK